MKSANWKLKFNRCSQSKSRLGKHGDRYPKLKPRIRANGDESVTGLVRRRRRRRRAKLKSSQFPAEADAIHPSVKQVVWTPAQKQVALSHLYSSRGRRSGAKARGRRRSNAYNIDNIE
eukprot:m.16313 g.16313  ORF g.16313 m.16313 type:complete len:118 (-) comp8964_c0_seq1:399-752(-)